MDIQTTSCVRDDATGEYALTMTAKVPHRDLERAVLAATGFDGLGDPSTSKGLQQVVFAGGTFEIMPYDKACVAARNDPDYQQMFDVSAVRAAIRGALN